MTSSEKELLYHMRQNGQSYSQIAQALGLSENTVKSYCHRTGIQAAAAAVCMNCKKPLACSMHDTKQRFCSNTCRYAWNYAHRILGEKNAVSKACICCRKIYFSYGSSKRRYCSRACYISDRFGKERQHDRRAV